MSIYLELAYGRHGGLRIVASVQSFKFLINGHLEGQYPIYTVVACLRNKLKIIYLKIHVFCN